MSWRSTLTLLAALSAVGFIVSSPVRAQPAATPPTGTGAQPTDLDAAARTIFEDGRRAFGEGDYDTALSRFQQAYEISHRPPLLWNIATTLDRLRRDEEALAAFQQFLEADPNTASRAEIEARIRVLQRAVDEQHAHDASGDPNPEADEGDIFGGGETHEPTTPPPAAQVDEGGGGLPPIVFIVGAGLTAVAAGVAIWSGTDTNVANDNYVSYSEDDPSPTYERSKELYDDAHSAQTRTNILFGVTGALAVGTVVVLLLTDFGGDEEQETASIRPSFAIGSSGAAAGLAGSF